MAPTQSQSSKIKRLPVFEDDRELQKFLEISFTDSLKQMIRVTVKTMVKAEMESFRAEFHEKLSFNGTYGRNLTSTWGRIDDVPIPRFRESVPELSLKATGVFDEEKEKFEALIAQMHLLGISQRKIAEIAKVCLKAPLSKTRVGAIHKELAEQEEFQINRQPLDDQFEYLLIDGIWEKTKGYGWDDNRSVLLCALGVRPDGSRKVVGFTLARKEDTTSCRELLENIKERGLRGRNLKLAICDDAPGIKAAVGEIYPTIPIQLCIVHKIRNVLRVTSYQHKQAVADDLKAIFASRSKQEATATAKAVVKKWFTSQEKAMASLRFNLEYCFTYFQFPETQWSSLRTTNVMEREFREVRRRMKGFDSTFQSQESGERYANTILSYLNNHYPLTGHTH
ncbi:MAG: IS256 family transposase [Patescibacteria group bacterium]|nr:IS256 family transposase [Candidatus Micrarchaeota archaeon]MDE2016041.1 IS256 family transposase [Patescibacteria group bacterium]